MSTRSFELDNPINLDCRFGTGSLTVQLEPDLTRAEVTVTARHPGSDAAERTSVTLDGRTLKVEGPRLRPRPGALRPRVGGKDAMDIVVRIPAGTAARVGAHSAEITFNGRSGSLDIAGVGNVHVDEVDGDLRVRSGSGSFEGRQVTGEVVIRSGNGDVTLGEVGGRIVFATGHGSLDIGTAHGAVIVRTGSGSAGVRKALGDVNVVSGSGGITVGLPAGRPAKLDIVTGNGQMLSELPIERSQPKGGAPITIQARTGSGDVRLFRAA